MLPALNILTAVSVLVALLFLVNVFRRQWVIPVIGAGLLVLTSVVVGAIYPMLVQQFQVRPSELVREQPYLERNINATRDAYDIADVRRSTTTRARCRRPSAEVLDASAGTLNNIRLLDPAVVSPTFNQLQQIRGYYAFNDKLDVDRYTLDDAKRGAIVAAREINLAGIPDGQRNWTNDRLVYTHGYGLVAAYDNTALSNGQPDFFESDIPPTGGLDVAAAARLLRRAVADVLDRRRARGLRSRRARLPRRCRARPARRRTPTRARAACRWARCSAACCSRRSSRTRTSCCPTSSTPTRGSCGTATR